MGSFRRIFKYLKPYWFQIVVVIVAALVIAASLSLSLLTAIPMLNVMIAGEGLHGWLDRKTVDLRYGMDFAIAEVDQKQGSAENSSKYLLVTNIKDESPAKAAGFNEGDRIFGITVKDADLWQASDMLHYLAVNQADSVEFTIRRVAADGQLENKGLILEWPDTPEKAKAIGWSRLEHFGWSVKVSFAPLAQKVVSLMPRGDSVDKRMRGITFIIIVVSIVTVFRCIAKFYQSYFAEKIVQMAINELREDAYWHVMKMPVGFFSKERPSDTVSRLVHDTATIAKAIKIMLGKALREPLNAIFMLGAAFWLNWQLTLIFMAMAPVTVAAIAIFGKKMKKATRRSLMASSEMLSKLQETMSGLRVVKIFNQQGHERNRFHTVNQRLLKQLFKISKTDAATSPVMEVIGMFAGAVAIIVGAHWVSSAKLDGSEFLVLLGLLGISAEALRKTSDVWNKIQEANAASDRVFGILDNNIEIESPDACELQPLRHKIEFQDIHFTYPGSEHPVLRGVSLTVEAGQRVAIVGSNGSGKTTLANLIPRFYDPDSGRILIDGKDIKEGTLFSLRNQMAMVTQQIVTFTDTVAANIAYSKPEASLDEIIAAAKSAYAHEFIELMPEGYNTLIGENGAGLSGGQLQRIIIARAILKDPDILIFDEATSQVDAESESKIHQALQGIMKNRTSFVIAHRFSTVVGADMIVVMDRGKIIAKGRHDELVKTCSLYHSLYETQLVAQN